MGKNILEYTLFQDKKFTKINIDEDRIMKQQIYANIADDIIKKIQGGTYKADEKLPSERNLSDYYDASISSIKKALKKLIDLQYIYSVERSGYFVMPPKFDEYIFYYNDKFLDNLFITQEYTKPVKYVQNISIDNLHSDVPLCALLFVSYKVSSKTLMNYEEKYLFIQKNTLKSIKNHITSQFICDNIEKYSTNSEIFIETDIFNISLSEPFIFKPDIPFFKITKKSYDKYGKIVGCNINYYNFNNFNIKCFSEYL